MRITTLLIFTLLATTTIIAQEKSLSLVPRPLSVKQGTGAYLLKDNISVSNALPGHEWPGLFRYFRDEMKKQFGITVTEAVRGKKGDIDFFMKRMPTGGKPAYTLEVNGNGIFINSNFAEPAFHAMQTLFQLLPVDPAAKKEIPFVEIFDHARFDYRGMHLDVGRHLFPLSFIKKYIDYLAWHKLNTFHWHLTEDQGWRIEIKKYPKLTSVGGWRNGTITGRYPGQGNDSIRYGGYYTQEEIKEVVKYAKERFVRVIPEIEMPGHSSAAIAAYPELSCFPDEPTINFFPKTCTWSGDRNGKQVQQTWGVFDDVFCAGKENTFSFLENVMDEVLALFPSEYIHVGGDESPKDNWKRCPLCQKRIKDLNLKDEHELQSYFIQRMEKYLNKKGRILIGWDEILEGGLAPNAVVMSWRGEKGGIEAAKQKHKVIMSPGNPVYFDHTQSENEDSVTIGGYNPIEKVYAWDPVPKELNEEEAKFILGAQANVWAEYMKNTQKVEYMIFPRMAALSEVLWSTKENRDWNDFEPRLMTQIKRYEQWKVNFSKAYFDLRSTVMPSPDNNGIFWKLESRKTGTGIQYNKVLDRSDPPNPPAFFSYSTPVQIVKSGTYQAWAVENGLRPGNAITQKFILSGSTGKKISLSAEASKNYPGDGAFTLVNGVQNEKGMSRTKEFLGFNGTDCIATIDMGKEVSISFVKLHYLHHPGSWIHQPSSVIVSVSTDGINFTTVALSNPSIANNEAVCEFLQPANARYVRVHAANFGKIPAGNPGAGSKAWLFVDEIEVN